MRVCSEEKLPGKSFLFATMRLNLQVRIPSGHFAPVPQTKSSENHQIAHQPPVLNNHSKVLQMQGRFLTSIWCTQNIEFLYCIQIVARATHRSIWLMLSVRISLGLKSTLVAKAISLLPFLLVNLHSLAYFAISIQMLSARHIIMNHKFLPSWIWSLSCWGDCFMTVRTLFQQGCCSVKCFWLG